MRRIKFNMPETKVCDTCGKLVNHIPAGTSKTKTDSYGNPKKYDAFWICSNDNCSSRKQSTQNTQTPPTTKPNENNGTKNAAVQIIWELQEIKALLEQLVNSKESSKEETWKPPTSSTESEPPLPTEG